MSFRKEISVKADDGFVLKGFLQYPQIKKEKYPAVIFAHQFGTTHIIWSDFAKLLREKGYATFLIDLRGHGLSVVQNGRKNSIVFKENFGSLIDLISFFRKSSKKVNFSKIPEDIALWIDHLIENEKIDPDNIILVGSSLGATGILPVPAVQDVKAIICISPGPPEIIGKENVKTSLPSLVNPSLFVASVSDPLNSGKYSIFYQKITPSGTLILLPGNKHGVVLLKKAKGYILEFLNQLKSEDR